MEPGGVMLLPAGMKLNTLARVLWIVGEPAIVTAENSHDWGIVGIFETEEEAAAIAEERGGWCGPITLGAVAPVEPTPLPGSYWPAFRRK